MDHPILKEEGDQRKLHVSTILKEEVDQRKL